ncbi:HDOD domain-containing protein [Luteibacter sp. UNCMF366Tsu5.1]|uniref:HDOD domain-containing protein n=1 Tax=Luteibacter sp. UNCMF366Tsu5.1 TaxID=1502758 RepID=UPI000908F673|nr:HDOD domain-containing protein [Luteibacter sp. UNCMF366Tsu5.1]SFW21482.1 HD-like signal output (HDOD) domain, no enzymatic activity [Luteibacter sp. UNCMF366Tsu5.1]
MIGRFFRKWFGATGSNTRNERERPPLSMPVASIEPTAAPPAGALDPDEVEDRFYRLVFGFGPSREGGLSPAEQATLRRVRDAFGGERFDVGSLPRLPAVVPQLMRSLRSDDVDSRTLAEQIARDTVLVGEVIRAANSAYLSAARPVSGLPQAITLLGHDGLRRVVMQMVMRPILRADENELTRQAGERLWEHAERCAHACIFLSQGVCDSFEAFLAGLASQTGAQAILREVLRTGLPDTPDYSAPFVAALGQQVERLSLHAARHWSFPSRVVQALAERADPADAGARTPLGRALLASSRLAMLDVMVERGTVDADAVLLATPPQGFSQERLLACRDDLRARATADA